MRQNDCFLHVRFGGLTIARHRTIAQVAYSRGHRYLWSPLRPFSLEESTSCALVALRLNLILTVNTSVNPVGHRLFVCTACRMTLVMAGVAFVALSGLVGVSHQDAGAPKPDVTPAQALTGILLTLLSQFVGATASRTSTKGRIARAPHHQHARFGCLSTAGIH